jgi:hypothetical protein
VQLFSNNWSARKLYEKTGFAPTIIKKASDETILEYLGHDEKMLMEKNI